MFTSPIGNLGSKSILEWFCHYITALTNMFDSRKVLKLCLALKKENREKKNQRKKKVKINLK